MQGGTTNYSRVNKYFLNMSAIKTPITPNNARLLPVADPSQHLRFLELGCGSGLPVTKNLLSYPSVHVTANDLSTTQIELAKNHLLGASEVKVGDAERLTFIEGDITGLEFPDKSFDAIFALYSLIHLPREEQTEMISKIGRWLKPGGYLLANFLEKESEVAVIGKWLGEKGWMFWGKERTLKIVEDGIFKFVVSNYLYMQYTYTMISYLDSKVSEIVRI
ncbi:methyltransferase domain-containing protein [Rostrohypoxylon terebratum]|nr:methyltransferase domain-containing protein [Rostrohypoxylon terebratum]